jgi:hypothetical protein
MSRILGTETRSAGEGSLWIALLVFGTLLSCGLSLAAQSGKTISGKARAETPGTEEFFVVSSVDIAKGQLLLKRPTEITELLQVNDKTHYTGRNGKAIQFSDLRAGDTVYIRSTPTAAGRLAVSVRRGPMTLEELHRHYLK